MKNGIVFFVCFFIYGFVFQGCLQNNEKRISETASNTVRQSMEMHSDISKAICVLHPTKGNTVKGIITFLKEANGIKVNADIEGLKAGKHGFHIHEFGDCSADDGTSAGGHFNPDGVKHGARTDSIRHVGDFGNIEANEMGRAQTEFVDTQITFSGEHSIIGRAVIIHGGEDDLTSQPSGNAGARVACGIIGISK